MKLKILFFGCFMLVSFTGFSQFITEWNTGATTTITVPTTGAGYNYTATIALLSAPETIINTLTAVTGNAVFSGLTINTAYQVKITGAFPRIYFNNAGDKVKLKNVAQWGTIAWTNFNKAFYGCTTMNITATDVPILSGVTNMASMFHFCAALNGPANMGSWNTSTVTDMNTMFNGAAVFNQNIGNWNTGAVTTMTNMFANASAFNQNISSWNTASVTDMSSMFFGATAFNQNIGNWNTAHVTTMNAMFQLAASFNQPIGNWNTASIVNMGSMFANAAAFNQPIGNWNTGAVTTMSFMFANATAFNQNIGNWNTASVTDMSGMFSNAVVFNQPIGNWNTAALGNMNAMFKQAIAFDQDITNWNTSAVWNMFSVFLQATAFNQDVSTWDISSAFTMEAMFKDATAFNQNLAPWGEHLNPNAALGSFAGGIFENCGMSVANYDATLVGFNENGPNGIMMGALGMFYCNEGAAARAHMILPVALGGKGWNISGDTSLAGSTPILATSGNNVSLAFADCNYDWSNPSNRARKMLIINPNGNNPSPSGVFINHNAIGTLPAGVTSNSGYYQISNATNSMRISNRLTTITDPGSYTENNGVIVRVYYSTSEYTNLVVNAPPVGDIVDAGWFLSDTMTPAGVVAGMSAGTYALPGAQKIIPFNSGSENSIAFVEFKLTKFGTIGLYAKTQQGSLAPELGNHEVEKMKVTLYPNPVGHSLTIQLPDVQLQRLAVINMLGQTVYSSTKSGTEIDVSFLSAGLYQIVLVTDKGHWNGKFIKE